MDVCRMCEGVNVCGPHHVLVSVVYLCVWGVDTARVHALGREEGWGG